MGFLRGAAYPLFPTNLGSFPGLSAVPQRASTNLSPAPKNDLATKQGRNVTVTDGLQARKENVSINISLGPGGNS